MSKSKIKPQLQAITFRYSAGAKEYLVHYTPKKFDNPQFTYRVEVYHNAKLEGTFRTGAHPSKTNALYFINQTEEQL